MSANVVNQMAYLRTSRDFPLEAEQLSIEVNKCYVDTANAVNNRTISMFPTSRPAINGESWFLRNNLKQQGFRQAYPFTNLTLGGTVTIPHGIKLNQIDSLVRIWGTLLDSTTAGGPYWEPLPWVDITNVTNQIYLYVDSTNIVITGGGGPLQPIGERGIVVLEWISQP